MEKLSGKALSILLYCGDGKNENTLYINLFFFFLSYLFPQALRKEQSRSSGESGLSVGLQEIFCELHTLNEFLVWKQTAGTR